MKLGRFIRSVRMLQRLGDALQGDARPPVLGSTIEMTEIGPGVYAPKPRAARPRLFVELEQGVGSMRRIRKNLRTLGKELNAARGRQR